MSVMHEIRLPDAACFDEWRLHARGALAARLAPDEVGWHVEVESGAGQLFAAPPPPRAAGPGPNVPARFMTLARTVARHSDRRRFALLYRLLARIVGPDGADLLASACDPDIAEARRLAKAVQRDMHKMKAFVRFRRVEDAAGPLFVAWFEPEHHIVEALAPFFVERFFAMRWSILTSRASLYWDGEALAAKPGAKRADAPAQDAMEEAWKIYFASIFNPARLKPKAMQAEMPKKYWHNLPEAGLIEPLIAGAARRMDTMIEAQPAPPTRRRAKAAAPPGPQAEPGTLDALAEAAAACRRCPLWRDATRTVFGEGPGDAPLVFVGEQPGDREDLKGRPFVGPAGQLFDKALAEAGIDRGKVYVTNAVKHFKSVLRGKRRIHQKPNAGEITACRWWLDKELDLVRPRLVVALGATAARALSGRNVAITRERGGVLELGSGLRALVTVHPSFLLRLPEPGDKACEFARFVEDLGAARALVPEAA